MNFHRFAFGAFLVIIFAGLISSIPGVKNSKENGEHNFQIFSENMGLNFSNKSCSHDSDGNGYVSCTGKTDTGELKAFECSAYGSERYLGNCKVAMPSTRRN